MTRVRLGAEERRQAIVAAAVPLFARNGFAGTTTKEIARSAEHLVSGALGDPVERDIRHRLTMNSLLHDGVYARHVFAWVTDEVLPLFRASIEAAARTGDLAPGVRFSVNDFWFGEHVAAMMAYVRLPGRSALPYQGGDGEVMEQALRFILRGLGLNEAAIALHLGAGASAPIDVPVSA
jgi:AcrR family transcriptional regulator